MICALAWCINAILSIGDSTLYCKNNRQSPTATKYIRKVSLEVLKSMGQHFILMLSSNQ